VSVLVVGAAGSVGSRLVRRLGDREVLGVDRMEGATLRCDLACAEQVLDLAAVVPADLVVCYLAANLNVAEEGDVVRAVVEDNVLALATFLAGCCQKIGRLIYLSSISVYGPPAYLPVDEAHPTAPSSLYGATKLAAETIARVLTQRHGMGLTVVRSTQLYGIESAAETLPHRLVAELRAGGEPRLTAAQDIVRDYLHVDDLVELLARVVDTPASGTYNAGSADPLELGELFRAAFMAFGRTFDLDRVRRVPEVGATSQVLDSAKARATFGFEPVRRVREWLEREAAVGDKRAN